MYMLGGGGGPGIGGGKDGGVGGGLGGNDERTACGGGDGAIGERGG